MQFIVRIKDKKDAATRRAAAQEAHQTLIKKLIASGNVHFGVGTLDARGALDGSLLIAEFDSRQQLDQWLASDPYRTQQVWDVIEVTPCQVGPVFKHLSASRAPSRGA